MHCSKNADTSLEKLRLLLSSHFKGDWPALGHFVFRVRQLRRQFRTKLQRLEAKYEKENYLIRKAAWRFQGKKVCRHGVFFLAAQGPSCPCMSPSSFCSSVWKFARWMPKFDNELRALVVTPFKRSEFVRIGCLQASLRQNP